MAKQVTECVGPPGTGKTTWLGRQVALATAKSKPEDILVLSFTKTAAQEVASRGTPLPKGNVSTIHSRAFRLLGRPDMAEPKVADFNEDKATERRLTRITVNTEDLGGGLPNERATQADAYYERAQHLRARMLPRDRWPAPVRDWYEGEWMPWKQANSLLDFTDLLEVSIEFADEGAGYEEGERPQVIFLDEAQDCSPLEMAAVKTWAQDAHLVVVGDPDQSIFEFKGADPNAMHIKGAQRLSLKQSRRVPLAVHRVAVEWVRKIADRIDAPYKPRDEEGQVDTMAATWKDPVGLVQRLQEHEDAGETCMVITACSYQLEVVKAELRNRAIPFHNPYRPARTDWNPLGVAARGKTTWQRMLAYTKVDQFLHGPEAGWWSWEEFHAWMEHMSAGPFERGMRTELVRRAKEAMEAEKTPPMVYPAEFKSCFQDPADYEQCSDGDLGWFFDNLMPAHQKRYRYPYQVAKSYGMEKLLEPPKIALGTCHSFKGGEADHVYLFPDISIAGHRSVVQEGWDNTIRLFYVGLTRARKSLTLGRPCEPYYATGLLQMVQAAADTSRRAKASVVVP